MRTFKINDRVQDKKLNCGTISEINPALKKSLANDLYYYKHDANYHPTAYINWDNGSSSTESVILLDREDNELEKEFRNAFAINTELINEKLKQASLLVDEAQKISDDSGIPFEASISPLSQNYVTDSFREKFSKIDKDFIDQFIFVDSYASSWEHSMVC